MAVELRPFHLAIPHAALDDLAARLARTRLPTLPAFTGWADGCDVRQFTAFLDYWRTEFSWRDFEARVNRWPQALATIDGCELHFLRVGPPPAPDAPPPVPLLLLHGWPGSFVEFLPLVEHLAAPVDGLSFDIVIPSLPGFGFSRRPAQGEMTIFRAADLFAELMRALGHERFLIQGGDFGAAVGSALALRHPARVLGLHLNYIPGSYRPSLPEGTELAPEETAFLKSVAAWADESGAYSHLHRTRPHALSIGLHDSPAGLAAWLLEKFAAWADCEGDIARLPRDLLAANLTLYWLSGSLASSIEFYRDSRRRPFHLAPDERVTPPCAVAHFPGEVPLPPRCWVERGYHVVRWTPQPTGGHFAALEQPALLARDLRAFASEVCNVIRYKPPGAPGAVSRNA